MLRVNIWRPSVALLSALSLTTWSITGAEASAPALSPTPNSPQSTSSQAGQTGWLAQAGQCRRVIRPAEGLVIRASASTSARQVGGVAVSQTVTLTGRTAQDGSRNWVQISQPVAGWVSNGSNSVMNLGPCSNPPPPVSNLCRTVARPAEGLIIRATPSPSAAAVGNAAVNQAVRLTTDPPTVSVQGSRTWVQVQAPSAGWVSNGLRDEPSNLVYCNQPPTPDRTYTVRSGDTLSAIAQRFYGDPNQYRRIAEANGLRSPYNLSLGQVLKIP